jgi:nucleoside-diphosphate-sugar epimerase
MEENKVELVTGASGFIGKHLANRLIDLGKSVRVLCRRGSESRLSQKIIDAAEIVSGDLRDKKSLLKATRGANRIFHCAGQVSDWGHLREFQEINVQGTHWLLEGAHRAQTSRFIHLSSVAAFGTPAPSYFDDDSEYGVSKDHYSATKVQGEKLAFSFYDKTGLPLTVLRPAVVYGPGGTWLEEPLRMIMKNQMFLLGGGNGTCHPCYIENLLDAMLLAADHPKAVGRGYIITDGDSITFREYFNALASLVGKSEIRRNVPVSIARTIASACEATARMQNSVNRPLLTHTAINMVTARSQTSMSRIKKELGFIPRFNFKSAILELKKWYGQRSTIEQ